MLTIEGEGMLRRELSWDDLAKMPGQVAHTSVLFGGKEVAAVPLSSLLRSIAPPGSARFMTFQSTDGYATTLPLAEASRALLVIRLGDAPLTPERGGPVRLVVTGANLRSCLKHVTHIRITSGGAAEVLPQCNHDAHRAA
jgi:DMSO/TMAO reductase YedYZ molybdopterin-dependent catalytic subunit